MAAQTLTYQNCKLCPRSCGVDRTAGERGFCGMPAHPVAARAAAHYWEEPPISGEYGSGAVFFSGCTLRCRFCQNADISAGGFGKPLTAAELRACFERLVDEGCQNLNLVTATHFLPTVVEALTPKLPVPVVYNCSGYERVETLRELEGLVDVYLPDYPAVARAAILEMLRQTGPAQLADGELRRGTLVRHLVLPGYVDNSLDAVAWLAEAAAPKGALVSILGQYCPMPGMAPPLDRPVTRDEYAGVLSWAELCGLQDFFYQDLDSASSAYIPDFSLQGL